MYNPLTEEEIKNNLREVFSKIEDKFLVEQVIETLMNENLKTIYSLNSQELNIFRERFGINEDKIPKTLKQIGEKYGLTGERIRAIEAKALRKLRYKIIFFVENFHLDQISLSDKAKEFLFNSQYDSLKNYLDTMPKEIQNSVEIEIRDEFSNWYNLYSLKYKEQLDGLFKEGTLDKPINDFGMMPRFYNPLMRENITTFRDLFEKHKWNSFYRIDILGNSGYNAILSILASIKKEEALNSYDFNGGYNEYELLIDFIIKETNNKMKNEISQQKNIVDTQQESEDLSVEHVLEKQQDENSLIRERIEKKEELLKKYKKVSDEKAELLEKEKELDDELKIIMEKIKGSYMENKNDRTKK